MKMNMGKVDRVIRTLLAIVIAILYFTNVISGTVGLILGIVAIVMLLTGVISFCPLYTLFGLSTRAKQEPAPPTP